MTIETNPEPTIKSKTQFHNGKLLALVEADEPYALKIFNDGYFETIGRLTFNGKKGSTFTAHPKIDPETGELLTFGYSIMNAPYCVYTVISPEGLILSLSCSCSQKAVGRDADRGGNGSDNVLYIGTEQGTILQVTVDPFSRKVIHSASKPNIQLLKTFKVGDSPFVVYLNGASLELSLSPELSLS